MSAIRVALLSQTETVTFEELSHVARALNTQVANDVTPIWGVNATVEAAPKDVPPGAWPIFIVKELPPNEGGFHKTQRNQPFAKVVGDEHWSLAASHELVEMLVDPDGNKLVAGPSLNVVDDQIVETDKRVEYLVEACDPCEAPDFAYLIDDVIVSDFFTPKYHDPVVSPGIKYSFTGALKQPRQILAGGYISWLDPEDGHAKQIQFFGSPKLVDLGPVEKAIQSSGRHLSLREFIDNTTLTERKLSQWISVHPIANRKKARRAELAKAAELNSKQYQHP